MVYVPEFVWLTPSHFLRPSSDTERGGCAKKVWISYLVFSLAYPSFVLRFGRASAALSGSGFATAAWLGRWPTNAVRSCPHSPRNTYLIGQLSQTAPRYSDDQESRLSLCSVITTPILSTHCLPDLVAGPRFLLQVHACRLAVFGISASMSQPSLKTSR